MRIVPWKRNKKATRSRTSSPEHKSSGVNNDTIYRNYKEKGCPPDIWHPYQKILRYVVDKHKIHLRSLDFSHNHKWIDVYTKLRPSELGIRGEERSYDFWQVDPENGPSILQYMNPQTGEPKDGNHFKGKIMKYQVPQGDVYVSNTKRDLNYKYVKSYFTRANMKEFPNNSNVSIQSQDRQIRLIRIHRAGQTETYSSNSGAIPTKFTCRVVSQLPHDVAWDDIHRQFERIYARDMNSIQKKDYNPQGLDRWILSWNSREGTIVAGRLAIKRENQNESSGRPKHGNHEPGKLERYYLPGMDLGHGQDGRSIMVPQSQDLPPELSVLASEHYIMNESNTLLSWEELAQGLMRSIASDFATSMTRNHRNDTNTPILQWIAHRDNRGHLHLDRAQKYETNLEDSFSAQQMATIDRPERHAAERRPRPFTYTGFDYRAWSHNPNCEADVSKILKHTGRPRNTRGWHRQGTTVTYYSIPIINKYDRDLYWDQIAEGLVKVNKHGNIVHKSSAPYTLQLGPGSVLILKAEKKQHEIIRTEKLYVDQRPKDGWLKTNAHVDVYIGRVKIRLMNEHKYNSVSYDQIYDELAGHLTSAGEGRNDLQVTIRASSRQGYVKLVLKKDVGSETTFECQVKQQNDQQQENRNQAHNSISTKDPGYRKPVPSPQKRPENSHGGHSNGSYRR